MKKAIVMAALSVWALTAQDGRLANGVYGIESGKGTGKNLAVRKVDGTEVRLDTAGFAPLVIEGKPEVGKDSRGSWLDVRLAPEAAKRLEELTRSRLNQRIAVVVGDRILSAPMVRSVIAGGKARLTPCEEESCRTLLAELSK